MKPDRTAGVESARKALNILVMFTEDRPEVTVEDVISEHELSQATAYRYLSLLRELDLVRPRGPGVYVLTRRITRLAAAVEDTADLERVAQSRLRTLSEATHETAFMLERTQNGARFVSSHQPDRSLTLSFRPGSVSPLHRGAAAKVLLAFSPPKFQQGYIARFIEDPQEQQFMVGELERVRDSGYAESLAEVDEGIWGGAVPVHADGEIVASLSLAGPAFRIDPERRPGIIVQLQKAAASMSRELGTQQSLMDVT